jgi:biotin carboxyl carrier protein
LHFEIEAGGRLRRVTVSRMGGGFAVGVDGHRYSVDVVRIDANTLSLIVDSGAAVHDAIVDREDRTERLTVRIGPVPITVNLNGRQTGHRRAAGSSSGVLRIASPMPGKVLRVLVEPGDAVRARQPVVVVEAMKMENALRADHDGTVAEVHVREGTLVEAGTLLIVIQ